MCVLDACCYCVFLNCGCFVLAALMLVSRLLIIAVMLNDPQYASLEITSDLTAAHITAILMIVGCITPIILLCGLVTVTPSCLKIFLILEIIFFAVFSIWQVYYIVQYLGETPAYQEQQEKMDEVAHWLFPAVVLGFEIYTLWVVYSYHWHLRRPYVDDFF